MATEVGFVTDIKGFLVQIDGLPSAQINNLVTSKANIRGWVTALLENKIQVLMLDEGNISPGEQFDLSEQKLTVNVGEFLLGRAINPLGQPVDGKGLFSATSNLNPTSLDQDDVPGIDKRQFINAQFETGIVVIDSLIPIGKGQRQLLVGDPRSGMADFLTNIIINQKNKDFICIYASIGKPIQEIRNLIDTLHTNSAFSRTTVIATASSDPAPLIYIAPKVAMAMAEYFQKKGKDVLLILDDMGNHAKIYREIALLSDRIPTRESYPADIFHEHAALMERAGYFGNNCGGGSITALPVISINLSDVTSYIPTNLMAMTDGHLLFKSALYTQGQRPAVDISQSVTRVGSQTQTTIQKIVALKIRTLLTRANQLQSLTHFSTELAEDTRIITHQGKLIEEILKQESLTFISKEVQLIMMGLVLTGFLVKRDLEFLKRNKGKIIQLLNTDKDYAIAKQQALNCHSEKELLQTLAGIILGLEKHIK